MTLARPINNSHAATADLLQDLIIADSPICIAQIDGSETRFERLGFVIDWCEPGLEQTRRAQTIAEQQRCGSAGGTSFD